MLRSTSMSRISPCDARSSGTSARPARDRVGGRVEIGPACPRTLTCRLSGRRPGRPPNRPAQHAGAARARPGPARPRISPACRSNDTRPRTDSTTSVAAAGGACMSVEYTPPAPARNSTRLVARRLGRRQLGDLLAVAQADDAVGDLQDLGQPVRDVDHPQPLLAQIAQQVEQAGGVAFGQRRGRLVEQQHLGVQRQRPRDLHPLLLPGRQVRQRRARVDAAAHPLQRLGRAPVERAAIDDAEAVRLVAQHARWRRRRDRSPGSAPAAPATRPGGSRRPGSAATGRPMLTVALVGQVAPGRDLHQRRLAGAVAADQTDDLAGRDREVDAPAAP